jgi:branched-chain amino acid transport system substrate-binding protein
LVIAALAVVALSATACSSSSSSKAADSSSGGSGGSSASSGSGGSTTSSAADTSPIVVAVSASLTGPLAFYDGEFVNSVKYGIQTVNAAGGVDGRQLKLVTNDNESSVSQAVPKAKALISQHPAVLMTSTSPDTAIPEARAAQEAGQLVFGWTGPPTFGSTLGDMVFNTYSGDPTEAATMALFAKQKGWTKVALACDQAIGYSKDVCALFKEAYKAQNPGSSIVADVQYNSSTDTTFPSQVTAIRNATGAQAVEIVGLQVGTPTLITQLRSAGVTLPIYGSGGGLDGTSWIQPIKSILGTFYSSSIGANNPDGGSFYSDNPNPDQKAFITSYEKEFPKSTLIQASSGGYASVQELVAAIKAAGGKTDSKSLATAMSAFNAVPTLVGTTTYTSKCHVPLGRPLAVTQVVNGVGQYVQTISPTTAQLPKAPC